MDVKLTAAEHRRQAARAADLRGRGFAMVTEEFGPPMTGKSFRARALQAKLEAEGKEVRVVDDIWQHGGGCRVQVWAKG